MKSAFTCFALGLLLSFQAMALTLQEAKTQGLVGEQLNGYLGLVQTTDEAKAIMADVNAKRKAHYEHIARKNNIATDAVAKLAAQKAIEAADAGHWLQGSNGVWFKK
ncbi:YdbL family protein [Shewanella sp. SR44-3]|uniref:YdbL family protein n=1 Tax=unclassified Shewanella TaxID=196818 RepID=UPI0015F98C7A|nr:YdbL family protein [Shewanella sp. SR44-3]MBB1270367.1 YdbL family protein [Shewanella sp. SR44-3]